MQTDRIPTTKERRLRRCALEGLIPGLLACRKTSRCKVVRDDGRRRYVRALELRARHHAREVHEIIETLAEAVVRIKDEAPIEVFVRRGEAKHVVWFFVEGRRYVLSYSHRTASVELTERTTKGRHLRSFSNATSPEDIRRTVDSLRTSKTSRE